MLGGHGLDNIEQVEAKLIVSRTMPKDIKIRGLFILLDGKEVANISYGKTFEMGLATGKHTLKVTNNLYSKVETLDVKEGETYRFEAGNLLSGLWAVIIGWSGLAPYKVVLTRVEGPDSSEAKG